MSKQIVLIIDGEGGVKLETKGFAGPGCKDASKALAQALGVTTAETPTAEAYTPRNSPPH